MNVKKFLDGLWKIFFANLQLMKKIHKIENILLKSSLETVGKIQNKI